MKIYLCFYFCNPDKTIVHYILNVGCFTFLLHAFQILTTTKSYVAENIVQPVLKRADSVKQLGLNGAELAATRIDTALDVADKYVEKYLPDATDVDKNGKISFIYFLLSLIIHIIYSKGMVITDRYWV